MRYVVCRSQFYHISHGDSGCLQNARGKLEGALRSPYQTRETIRFQSVMHIEHSAIGGEKGDIDGKPHPEHMNTLRRHDIDSLVPVETRTSQ